MVFGPIFRVELVTVARRRRYFLLRVVYGALALFVLWSTYASSTLAVYGSEETTSIQASQRLATSFFNAFTWMQMLAILIVGPAMAAGTIASERERRTIEYLFATDLSKSEIILGKTIARLCLLGQFVLVGLPILFVFRMLGGIGAQLLLNTYLLAASTAVLVTALGVCVSVWSPKSREATSRTYGILFVTLVFPLIAGSIGGALAPHFGNELWLEYGVPFLGYCKLVNPLSLLGAGMWGGQLDLATVAPTLFAQLLVAAALLLTAVAAVRRVHLSETTRTAKLNKKLKPQRTFKKQHSLGDRPMLWKELVSRSSTTRRSFAGKITIGLILGLLLMSSVLSFAYAMWYTTSSNPNNYFANLSYQTTTLGLGMLVLLAVNASGLVSNEKERDTWLSLISTPLTGQEILHGKALGNLYSMRWPAFILAFAWVLGVLLEPKLFWPMISLFATLLLLAWYVTNLGLYFSLRSKTTMRSMGATLATLCFFGGGYLMCCCPIMQSNGGGGGEQGMLLMLAPCIPSLLFYGVAVFSDTGMFGGGAEKTLPVAYALGLLLYLSAGAWLYWAATSEFDSFAGRCGQVPEGESQ